MGLHQTKKLLHSKGDHQLKKRQPTKWEKIFASDIFDVWVYKIYIYTYNIYYYKNLYRKYIKNSYNRRTKVIRRSDRQLSKEDMKMANWHMKSVLTSLIIRKMQIKTTMRYHLTLFRIAVIKKIKNSKC